MEADGAPVDGREYAVALGRSLRLEGADELDDDEPREVFATFRYEFQPASVDKRAPGVVSADDSRGVQVLMASSAGAPGGVQFKGKLADNKDTDCLLLFDGERFRLERCPFSCTQLRPVRATAPKRKLEGGKDESEAAVAAAGKPVSGKIRGKTGRPRGRPPKAKAAASTAPQPAKKPRTTSKKTAAASGNSSAVAASSEGGGCLEPSLAGGGGAEDASAATASADSTAAGATED